MAPAAKKSAKNKHFLIPDLNKLRKDVKAAKGLSKVNIDRMRALLKKDPKENPREVYDLHWAMEYLLIGSKDAKEKAKLAVWQEAMEHGPKSRPGHSWNDKNFFKMHFWISAAMASHIAIAVDWLATESVFSKSELNQIGNNFVNGFWENIYPHLKGRGRAPIYVEPMNQDSAMVAGCLIIGHLFGHKWMKDLRAQRMYADARVLAGNLLGQFFKTGFDNDGFTYMRIIQAPILCLISMVIEEIEGVDFYNQTFLPNDFSVAMFMEKMETFSLPSGSSFPHGRYGYVMEWNMYSLAYASRKTGSAHYLEQGLNSKQSNFITPWIAMDLPLAVAWAPYGKEAGIPKELHPPKYVSWHDPDIWSNLAHAKRKIHAHLCWRPNFQSSFLLEQNGERAVLYESDSPKGRNGISFIAVNPRKGIGDNFENMNLGWLQISRIQLQDQWDSSIIENYSKALMVFEDGIVISMDQFRSTREVDASYHLTSVNSIVNDYMDSEHKKKKIQILCTENITASEIHIQKDTRRPSTVFHTAAMNRTDRGFTALLVNFGDSRVVKWEKGPDWIRWEKDKQIHQVRVNPEYPNPFQTDQVGASDASMIVRSDENLAFFGVRRWNSLEGCLWSTGKINLGHSGQTLTIEKVNYGDFLKFERNPKNAQKSIRLSVLVGSGLDIYSLSTMDFELRIPKLSSLCFVQVNGKTEKVKEAGGFWVIKVKANGPTHQTRKKYAGYLPSNLSSEALSKCTRIDCASLLDQILVTHDLDGLEWVRRLLEHPDTYVRLLAADVLGWIGDQGDAQILSEKILNESSLTSEIGGLSAPWMGKWSFFSTVTVMADAIRKLGNTSVIENLQRALPMQTEPHAIDAIKKGMLSLLFSHPLPLS